MARRGDNIHKRKDKRWEGRYIHHYENGKAKYASVYGKTYSEVKVKLKKSIQNIAQKNSFLKDGNILFSDIVNEWLMYIKNTVRQQSYFRYKFLAEKHIIPNIGQCRVSELDIDMINSYLYLEATEGKLRSNEGLSESTVYAISYIIRSAINYGVTENKMEPFTKNIVLPNITKSNRIQILSIEEQYFLENYLTEKMDLYKLAILICLYTGIRLGEMCALKWTDDIKNQTINIEKTVQRIAASDIYSDSKTILMVGPAKSFSSLRRVPIPNQLLKFINYYKEHLNKDNYIITGTKKVPDPRTLEYKFKGYLQKSLIPNIKFHGLRHTFATRCVESGMDIKTLSTILGHSSVSITMNKYVHPSDESKLNQVNNMLFYCGQNYGHK